VGGTETKTECSLKFGGALNIVHCQTVFERIYWTLRPNAIYCYFNLLFPLILPSVYVMECIAWRAGSSGYHHHLLVIPHAVPIGALWSVQKAKIIINSMKGLANLNRWMGIYGGVDRICTLFLLKVQICVRFARGYARQSFVHTQHFELLPSHYRFRSP
jgi:hypothetical protein